MKKATTVLKNAARKELATALSGKFGEKHIVPGKKALRIKGITGSRAGVDVAPTVGDHCVFWHTHRGLWDIKRLAILSSSEQWTINFPEQHSANGIAKRARTAHRFKRVVRVFKRLRSYMEQRDRLPAKTPCFLVECLVYAVEDRYFLVSTDDRYGRVRRIAHRIQEILGDRVKVDAMTGINEIKPLFHPTPGWKHADAVCRPSTIRSCGR